MLNLLKSPTLISLFLRGITTVGRFSLVFFLSRFLSLSDIGFFSLVYAIIAYTSLISGFQFSAFANREIATIPREEQKNQFGNFCLATLPWLSIAIVLVLAVLLTNPVIVEHESFSNVFLFGLIIGLLVVLEHYGGEFYRIFIGLGFPIAANVCLLVRNGIWPPLLIVIYAVYDLDNVMLAFVGWLVAAIICILFGLVILARKRLLPFRFPIDSKWILKGYRVSFPLWLGVLFNRSPFLFDRWFIGYISIDQAGVYALWMTATSLILLIFEAGLFSIYLNRFMVAYKNDRISFEKLWYDFKSYGTLLILTVSFFLSIAFPIIPIILGNSELENYRTLFNLLIIANTIIALSLIPFMHLYVTKSDKSIVIVNILSPLPFFVTCLALLIGYGANVIAIAHILSALFVLVLRWALVMGYDFKIFSIKA